MDGDLVKDFDLKEILKKYLIHWKWFVLGVTTCLLIAYVNLRYTIPLYQASTTILVKDDKKGGMASELTAFSDMGLNGGLKSNLDNEIEILKSRTLIESTVKKLNLNISIIVEGKFVAKDIYKESPIEVILVAPLDQFYKNYINVSYKPLTSDSFELNEESIEGRPKIILSNTNKFHYGQLISTVYGKFIINKTISVDNNPTLNFSTASIIISPLTSVANSFRGRLKVDPVSKTSSVVGISVIDPVKEKAEDFLDNLIQVYNYEAATDKNFISENTSKFINNRLVIITEELDDVEKNVESFKTSNKVTDIQTEAESYIAGSTEYDKLGLETDIQLKVISTLLTYIKISTNSDLLPTNITADEGGTSGLINSYNGLVLDRNRILKSATSENPSVIKLNQQITSLKSTINSSLLQIQSSLNIKKRNLNAKEGVLNSKIGEIPVKERQFKVIARQQKVKEQLYLYLLQKREETAISLAATEPNARVIDSADSNGSAVASKKNTIYLGALMLGLLIPFGVIYLKDLLDNKIKSRLDLEGRTQIPFIGNMPTSDSPKEIIKSENRSSAAEAMRIIKANLEFVLIKVKEGKAKTIFLTSTVPNEGKTFMSANLAATIALSGKKVLLIGSDIRNPRLSEYFTLPEVGLANFLASKSLNIEDLIVKQDGFDDFYILPSGTIPPNPAELLMSKKVDVLFEDLKLKYDYIVVDTSPVSLVADTHLIAKHADCFVYVIRANYLEKRMLNLINSLYKEKKLNNMCLLLNDVSSTEVYGYGYGYGQTVTKKPWYKKSSFKIYL